MVMDKDTLSDLVVKEVFYGSLKLAKTQDMHKLSLKTNLIGYIFYVITIHH